MAPAIHQHRSAIHQYICPLPLKPPTSLLIPTSLRVEKLNDK